MAERTENKGLPQTSFSFGEITPALYGRVDYVGYYKGLRTCRNFIINKYGGADNRPGTEFIGNVLNNTKGRMIPFSFNDLQTYVLILTDHAMQIISDGAFITSSEVISTATINAPGINYNIGDVLTIVQAGGKGGTIQVTAVGIHQVGGGGTGGSGVTAFSILTPGNGYSTASALSTSGGHGTGCEMNIISVSSGAPLPVTVTTPWAQADLPLLKFTQSADVVTVTHPNYPPQQIERLAATTWQVVPFAYVNGPFQDINIDNTITIYASAISGQITLTSSKAVFTADMVGLPFYLEEPPDYSTPSWQVNISITTNQIVVYGANYYQAVSPGTTGTIPPTGTEGTEEDGNPGVVWQYLHSGFGIAIITGFTDSQHVTASVFSRIPDGCVGGVTTVGIHLVNSLSGTNVADQLSLSAPLALSVGDWITLAGTGVAELNGQWQITGVQNSSNYFFSHYGGGVTSMGTCTKTNWTYLWALPAWGSAQGYPATTTYFQDRQLFGGEPGAPFVLDMSRAGGAFLDFGQGNPVLDDDAIRFKLLSNQVNTIKHMVDLTYLVLFTSGGIYMIQGGSSGNNVITPGTINMSSQDAEPVSDIAPIKIHNYALFVQETGREVRTLGYSFAENAFIGQDITTMSAHLLLYNKIVAWAYQNLPWSCPWIVRDDGILLGLTFHPEQQITAWHRHDSYTKAGQSIFEDVCCVQEPDDNGNLVYKVYFIVNRTLQGSVVRCIERLAERYNPDPNDNFFVDCGLSYDGTPATTFSGLDYLDGETVAILADGMVYPQQTVSGGQVTISTAAGKVHIGLPITADLETLDISSAQSDLRDKKKIINSVSMIVDKTQGIMVGPDVDHLAAFKTRATENYGAPDNLLSKLLDLEIPCDWNKKGRIFVRQSQPLPASILCIIPQLQAGGH